MHSLLALGQLAMDMVGTLKIVGFVVGIPLVIIWWLTVKNTTALFYDKKKIRATFLFGIPGLILIVIGIFLLSTGKPMRAYIFVTNYGDREGKIEVNGDSYEIAARSWEKLEIRTKEDDFTAKGYFGDSVLFDTTLGQGSYISSLGGDKVIIAEEVEYSASSLAKASEDLGYEVLLGPGIARFSERIIDDLYDFDEEAPSTMSVSSLTSTVRKFDLQLTSQEALFKQFMDAIGSEGGNLDSLLGEDSLDADLETEEGELEDAGQ